MGLLSIGLAVGACGASAEITSETAISTDIAIDVATEAHDSPVVPTGRVALAAAEGEPHVLWFWGAH